MKRSGNGTPSSAPEHPGQPLKSNPRSKQIGFEREALRLRDELHLSNMDCLPHEAALATLPACEVTALKNISGLAYEELVHFRTAGLHIGAFAFKDADGLLHICFNDAHQPAHVRVYMMEELFHVRLGHPFDSLRIYPGDRVSRTYDESKEDEAYGCAVAALVPYGGLHEMLSRGHHIARIAEHFAVPPSVVEFRIAATNLGTLASRVSWSSNPNFQ
jgi:hypothetical protein